MQRNTTIPEAVDKKAKKFSDRDVTAPELKQQILDRFEVERIREISQSTKIRAEKIESVIREGYRRMRESGAIVNFRCERVSGFGKPIQRENLVAMQPRVKSGEAA